MLNSYLNHVHFVHVGKHSIHTTGQLFPRPGDREGVEAITVGVKTHVDGAWADWTAFKWVSEFYTYTTCLFLLYFTCKEIGFATVVCGDGV